MGSGGMIGRLFVGIGGDTKELNLAMKNAVDSMKGFGIETNNSGLRFIATIKDMVNPTVLLTEKIILLKAAGLANAEIMQAMGKEIKSAIDVADKGKQPVSDLIREVSKMGESGKSTGISIEGLGKTLTEFARNPLQAAQAGIGGMLTKMGPLAVGLGGIAAAVGIAGKALFDFVSSAADGMEKFDNMSAMTGMAVEDLQAFAQIAKEAGLESLDLGRTIGMLNKNLGDSDPNEFTKAMKEMGIAVKDSSGQTKDAVTVLDEMRTALLGIEDPSQRAQLAQQVLGGRLRELIPLLLNSKSSMAEMVEVMKDSGVVYDELTQKHLRDFDSAMDKLGRTYEAAKVTLQSWIGYMFQSRDAVLGKAEAVDELTAAEKKEREEAVASLYVARAEAELEEYAKTRKKELVEATKQQEKASQDAAQAIKDAAGAEEQWGKVVDEATKIVNKATGGVVEYRTEIESLFDSLIATSANVENSFFDNLDRKAAESMDKLNQHAIDSSEKLAESVTKNVAEVPKAAEQVAGVWQKQISTIFTDMSRQIANAIIEWKGFGETLISIGKSIAESLLRTLVESLMQPLMKSLSGFVGGLFGGGGGGGLGSMAGGLGGLLGGLLSGGGGIAGIPFSSSIAASQSGIIAALLGGGGAAGGGAAAGGAGGLAGLFGLGGGAGMLGLGALTIPVIGALVAAGVIGVPALINAIQGKNSWEAGSMELSRDFGGISFSTDQFKQWSGGMGLSESQAYGIRKDLLSSPQFLTAVAYPLAQTQGKLDAFLTSLENVTTAWGSANFRDPFEKWMKTGVIDDLNKAFLDLFSQSQKLVEIMPDFATKLIASGKAADDAAKATATFGRGMDRTNEAVGRLTKDVNTTRDAIGGLVSPIRNLGAEAERMAAGMRGAVRDIASAAQDGARYIRDAFSSIGRGIGTPAGTSTSGIRSIIDPRTGKMADEQTAYMLTHPQDSLTDPDWQWAREWILYYAGMGPQPGGAGTVVSEPRAPGRAPTVPRLAEGGTISKTGLAVVHAGETVVPAGGQGMTVNVYNYGPVVGSDMDKIISQSITRTYRRGGLAFLPR